MKIPDITLIITNWNGKDLLRECVPSILKAVDFDSKRSYEIMVVDDCSTDDSLKILEEEFPEVTRLKTPFNMGFQRANNYGIEQTQSKLVMPMNNDIKLDEDALFFLAEHFKKENVFSVSGKFFGFDGKTFLLSLIHI